MSKKTLWIDMWYSLTLSSSNYFPPTQSIQKLNEPLEKSKLSCYGTGPSPSSEPPTDQPRDLTAISSRPQSLRNSSRFPTYIGFNLEELLACVELFLRLFYTLGRPFALFHHIDTLEAGKPSGAAILAAQCARDLREHMISQMQSMNLGVLVYSLTQYFSILGPVYCRQYWKLLL